MFALFAEGTDFKGAKSEGGAVRKGMGFVRVGGRGRIF